MPHEKEQLSMEFFLIIEHVSSKCKDKLPLNYDNLLSLWLYIFDLVALSLIDQKPSLPRDITEPHPFKVET